ncbi:MAG TPA: ATP cone domain-containing protein [Spirochaetia bacterium]|nr:ATP cone domain-containing protein [Spirochaetia bacterium]
MSTPEMIVKRDGRTVPFHRQKISSAIYRAAVACGGRDQQEAERVTDDVLALVSRRQFRDTWPTVEEIQDLVEKALIERGHARVAKAYIVYRYEHALKRAGRESLTYSSENIPYRKLWEALTWALDQECVTLQQLSALIVDGRLPELIAASDAFYEQELDAAAERILGRREELRAVIVAGPSSSGKSTTALKVRERLEAAGISTVALTLDNYFFDLPSHPRIGEDDYDFETPQALDLALINEHLAALVAGRTVTVPRYDFKTGRRAGSSGEVTLPPGAVLLLDSLHGLFPEMTASLPEESKFRLYVETLSQVRASDGRYIRWADVRMMRRVVRDMQFRGYSPRSTIRHWPLVRRAEMRYIVPELRRAHAIVNSYLPYELPVMKARIQAELAPLIDEFEAAGEERQEAKERAARIQALFDQLPAVSDERLIPGRSLLREFIGGSQYQYH